MKRGLVYLSLVLAVSMGVSFPAQALKISPFKATLLPHSPQMTQVFRLENNSDATAALQVSILSWNIAPDGTEINEEVEDDFVVFPAQLVLPPHESRAIRIQWRGPPDIKSEKSYRVLAEQIPVRLKDTPETGSAVKFMVRFKAALYVTPPGIKSNVTVKETRFENNRLHITLTNDGTAHTLLKSPVLTLTGADGKIVTLDSAALKPMDGENMHAGATRIFIVPAPADNLTAIRSAHLDFEPAF